MATLLLQLTAHARARIHGLAKIPHSVRYAGLSADVLEFDRGVGGGRLLFELSGTVLQSVGSFLKGAQLVVAFQTGNF